MRLPALLCATSLLCGFSASALAGESRLCDYQLQYDVEIDGERLRLDNARTAPDVLIDGTRLWVGGREQELSATERQRLADYATELRHFTRNVSEVALQGAQLGIDGATLALAALAGEEGDGGRALRQRFDGLRAKLALQLDGRHLGSQLLSDEFDRELDATIDQIVEDSVAEIGGGVARLVAMSLFAPSRLEARAERAEKLIDAHLQQRGQRLERQADALCGQVRRLDALENSLDRFDAFDRDAPSV
jgi:hypothetical protein